MKDEERRRERKRKTPLALLAAKGTIYFKVQSCPSHPKYKTYVQVRTCNPNITNTHKMRTDLDLTLSLKYDRTRKLPLI